MPLLSRGDDDRATPARATGGGTMPKIASRYRTRGRTAGATLLQAGCTGAHTFARRPQYGRQSALRHGIWRRAWRVEEIPEPRRSVRPAASHGCRPAGFPVALEGRSCLPWIARFVVFL